MIRALFVLLALQLVGEALAEALALPVPGPVIGMGLLFAGLLLRSRLVDRGVPEPLERTARGFLDNLGLLFVPAGVGVTLHLSQAAAEWQAILAAVLGATVVTIVATALVFRWLSRLTDPDA
jgi:holin-like protein